MESSDGNRYAATLPIATASNGHTMKYASSIIQPVAKLMGCGKTRAV